MIKQLTYGMLKQWVSDYIGNNELGAEIAESISNQIGCRDGVTDSDLIGAYEMDVNAIFTSEGDEFDCFLIDNQLKLMFASSSINHVLLRTALMSLYVIKNQLVAEPDSVLYGFGDPYKLSDIYTGLCLGVYESGRWGGRSIIYGEEYSFSKNKQARLSTCHNLNPLAYSKESALADLKVVLA